MKKRGCRTSDMPRSTLLYITIPEHRDYILKQVEFLPRLRHRLMVASANSPVAQAQTCSRNHNYARLVYEILPIVSKYSPYALV